MEYFTITKTDDGFHIEGFPDAVKVIRLVGPKAKRLSHLALHKHDLDFALGCLEKINSVKGEPVIRQALWRAAIVYFAKCFGHNQSRLTLDPEKVYQGDADGQTVFEYFFDLRNKHIVHDENSFAQSLPGAVLNKRGLNQKIAKIVCLDVLADTLHQEAYSGLHLLITRAREWVTRQFDELCNVLTRELEAADNDDLIQREGITYIPYKHPEVGTPKIQP